MIMVGRASCPSRDQDSAPGQCSTGRPAGSVPTTAPPPLAKPSQAHQRGKPRRETLARAQCDQRADAEGQRLQVDGRVFQQLQQGAVQADQRRQLRQQDQDRRRLGEAGEHR